MGGGDASFGGRRALQWDILGYYKLLGLEANSGGLSDSGAHVVPLFTRLDFAPVGQLPSPSVQLPHIPAVRLKSKAPDESPLGGLRTSS